MIEHKEKYPRLKTHVIKWNDQWQIDVVYMNDIKGYNTFNIGWLSFMSFLVMHG